MNKIKTLILVIVAVMTVSTATAQNDVLLQLWLEGNYDYYRYNHLRPNNLKVHDIQYNYYPQAAGVNSSHKQETTIYHYDYNNGNLISINDISYSKYNQIPYISSVNFYYEMQEEINYTDKLLATIDGSDLCKFSYDNSGRLVKVANEDLFTKDKNEMSVTYSKSNMIETLTFKNFEDVNAKVKIKHGTNTITIPEIEDELPEMTFTKYGSNWVLSKDVEQDNVTLYNSEGKPTEWRRNNKTNYYTYNKYGDLIKIQERDSSGTKVISEYEYEYDDRMNWVKKYLIVDGNRTLIADRIITYSVK